MVALVQSSLRYSEPAQGEWRIVGRQGQAAVEARRWDHSIAARRQPRLRLTLQDLSMEGVSAQSDVPLMPGERISFRLPRESGVGTWEAFGRVIRCEPGGMGYRLAVAFDALPAA